MFSKKELGYWGEDLAAKYLEERGYKILKKNFRSGRQEIDLVADKDGVLVLVEVKTRTNPNFGQAIEAVDSRKINQLKKALNSCWSAFGRDFKDFNLEVVAIDFNKNNGVAKISHFKDIF